MIARVVQEEPAPPPPKTIVLEMSEEDAEILFHIVNTDASVPAVVRDFTHRPEDETARFCRAAQTALLKAGVTYR